MSEYEDVPYVVIERPGGAPAAFLWGALLGAATALLFAPRSGSATRGELRDAAQRIRSDAEDRVTSARDDVERRVQQVRDDIDQRVVAFRGDVEARADQAREAVEAGRRAAEETREQLKRRLASAKGARGGDTVITARGGPDPAATSAVVTEIAVEQDADEIPLS
jgi:gas vesicle protein